MSSASELKSSLISFAGYDYTLASSLRITAMIIVVKYFFKTDLSHLLTLVFVSLSGSRLVLICPHKCFPVLIFCFYLSLEFMLCSRVYLSPFKEYSSLVVVRCQFFIGGRVCDVRADLGTLVSLKFLFGFFHQRFSFSLVCSSSSIATMLCRFTYTKILPTPSSP